MNDRRKGLGKLGEDAACFILQKQGYKILARNYHSFLGEIDIIALDKDTLVFVEVKLRTTSKFGLPEEAVDKRKIDKIKNVGFKFWQEKCPNIKKARIDVVSLKFQEGKIESRVIKSV
ncbi:MAG: UPF0102 protein [Patescibacteria group bacterium]|nr:MAG: UPF0102 protein [Patescibacteria group bacterium]